MPTIRQLKKRSVDHNDEDTIRMPLTVPENMVNRFRQQACRDGCFRSAESHEPNLSKWIMLTLAAALDDDLCEGMTPYKGPGRRHG